MNKLETITLDNGLNIYLYNDKRRHSTFFQLTTFCGGITKHFKMDGKDYHIRDGVSHILEHYLVECNEGGHFLDKLGKMNMSTNASTSINTTSYYFDTVCDELYGIKTILNGVYNVQFLEDKLEKLKGPINQEIRGRFDNKFYHLGKIRTRNLFKNIDFVDVGGTLEDISKTTVDDLEALYKAFYRPSNQFILVAGNFNKDEVVREIESFFDKLDIEKHEVLLVPYNEEKQVAKISDLLEFTTPVDYLDISIKVDISLYSPKEMLDLDTYLAFFLDCFFGSRSVLHKKLIDEKTIIDGIGYSTNVMDKYMIITIGAYTNDVSKFKNSVLDAIKKMDGFDEEAFEVLKKNSIVRLILRDENIFKMVNPLLNNIIYFDYPFLDEVCDIEQLSYDRFVEVIKHLDFSQYTITQIKNKE